MEKMHEKDSQSFTFLNFKVLAENPGTYKKNENVIFLAIQQ